MYWRNYFWICFDTLTQNCKSKSTITSGFICSGYIVWKFDQIIDSYSQICTYIKFLRNFNNFLFFCNNSWPVWNEVNQSDSRTWHRRNLLSTTKFPLHFFFLLNIFYFTILWSYFVLIKIIILFWYFDSTFV